MKVFLVGLLATAFLTLGIVAADDDDSPSVKKPFGQHLAKGGGGGGGATQILYHGGPVLTGNPVPVYAIYYGGMANFPVTTEPIIDQFLMGLGPHPMGTPQFKVNTSYCEAATTACPADGTARLGTARLRCEPYLFRLRLAGRVR